MVEKLSIVLLAFVLLLTFCSKTKTQASGFNLSQLYETNYQLYNSSFDYSFNSGDSDSNLLNGSCGFDEIILNSDLPILPLPVSRIFCFNDGCATFNYSVVVNISGTNYAGTMSLKPCILPENCNNMSCQAGRNALFQAQTSIVEIGDNCTRSCCYRNGSCTISHLKFATKSFLNATDGSPKSEGKYVTTLSYQPTTDVLGIETTEQAAIHESTDSFVTQSSTSNISFISNFKTTSLPTNTTIETIATRIVTQPSTTNEIVATSSLSARNSTQTFTSEELTTSPGGGSTPTSVISLFTVLLMIIIAMSLQ